MNNEVIVSKSLIRTTKPSSLTKENDSDFCLGLLGWCLCSECSDFSMASKSGQLVQPKSVKKTGSVKVSAEDRFVFDINDKELSNMKNVTCPSNTLKNNEWARQTFEMCELRETSNSQRINVQTLCLRIKIQHVNGCVSL